MDEDRVLTEAVLQHGLSSWGTVACSLEGRTARQCKERWNYYLSPELNHTPWTPEEDALLVAKQQELGSKWVVMAPFFQNRTDAMLKNRWHMLQRKQRLKPPHASAKHRQATITVPDPAPEEELPQPMPLFIPPEPPSHPPSQTDWTMVYTGGISLRNWPSYRP
jgi:hypothetical protein